MEGLGCKARERGLSPQPGGSCGRLEQGFDALRFVCFSPFCSWVPGLVGCPGLSEEWSAREFQSKKGICASSEQLEPWLAPLP